MPTLELDTCPDGGARWILIEHGSVVWSGRLLQCAADAADALDDVPPKGAEIADAITLEDVEAMWSDVAA